MKHRIFTLLLVLTLASWSQTSNSTPKTAPGSNGTDKAVADCCEKMSSAGANEKTTCMRHAMKDGAETSCCAGMNGMSASCCGQKAAACMKKNKNAVAGCDDCCVSGKCVMPDCGTGCTRDRKASSGKTAGSAKGCC